jgi:hypothetical protein
MVLYDPCNKRPHANRGPTAPTALLFYVDGVPGLDGDPFCGLCCLVQPVLSLFMAALPCAAYVVPPFGYSALRRLCWLSCVACVACGLALFSNGVFRVGVRISRLWFIE